MEYNLNKESWYFFSPLSLEVTVLMEVVASPPPVVSWHLDVGRNYSITDKSTSVNSKLRLMNFNYVLYIFILKGFVEIILIR